MAKSKRSRGKKTTARRKKSGARRKPRPAPRAKTGRGRKVARKKVAGEKPSRRRVARRLATRRSRRPTGSRVIIPTFPPAEWGLGADAGGQSGDTEGISRAEIADSESVEELLEEGQAFEAGVVSGIENAPDADKGEIRTREVPEDDVPQEYLDED